MNPIHLESVGVLAPGLAGWSQTRAILAGEAAYVDTPPAPLKPAKLAPDVRRRTTDHIRLAVEVASEATAVLGDAVRDLPSVFATSDSDGDITHSICLEVAKPEPQVSPTRFHNSVTNAPAGYWCMAVGSQAPSTSLSGYDATFTVGLLESAVQLQVDTPAILLVAHDTPLPEPLHGVRPFHAIFGVALVLTREPTPRSLARLSIGLAAPKGETLLSDSGLETLRRGNPAARVLPLLAAVAARRAMEVRLPYLSGQGMIVNVEPII